MQAENEIKIENFFNERAAAAAARSLGAQQLECELERVVAGGGEE